ncbi:hypothetical protein F5883DRAFT_198367 [Diaporthe sp. PMI_573]|nr:hypothetical protein F5883DRAFT_198367 [Diaporthaceae sp. PMI_573]
MNSNSIDTRRQSWYTVLDCSVVFLYSSLLWAIFHLSSPYFFFFSGFSLFSPIVAWVSRSLRTLGSNVEMGGTGWLGKRIWVLLVR